MPTDAEDRTALVLCLPTVRMALLCTNSSRPSQEPAALGFKNPPSAVDSRNVKKGSSPAGNPGGCVVRFEAHVTAQFIESDTIVDKSIHLVGTDTIICRRKKGH